MARASFRQRLALATKLLFASRTKDFVPPLLPFDGDSFDASGRLNNFTSKADQLAANIGWCYAANTAIADPCAAVELKLYRKKKDGDREEIKEHEILDLLDMPNFAHTGEQLRQLHFTYMNFVGESYIHMLAGRGNDFIPAKGKLPQALEIFPAHNVQFKQGDTYLKSIVRYAQNDYPLASVIRDLNPDPKNPYNGRSVIAAAAATIDTDDQMKDWNRGIFARGARPSFIVTTNEQLRDEVYERMKKQFDDEHTGTENSFRPLLIENGDAKSLMLSPQDLDFLASREFSMKEILSLWRVSPGMLGQVDNVNRANLEAGFYIHALVNTVPRVRQFVRQLNASFVKIFDPSFELDFENPVPEDVEAKLAAATAGVDKWWTKDEVRDMYGEKPLPDGLGEHIIIVGKGGAQTLDSLVGTDGVNADDEADVQDPQDPNNDGEDDLTESPNGKNSDKALAGVKKKP